MLFKQKMDQANYRQLRFLSTALLILTAIKASAFAPASAHTPFPERDNIHLSSAQAYNENQDTIAVVCDTLILRQICDYCEGENSTFYPRKFAENTTCLCYRSSVSAVESINEYIRLHKDEIKVIVIENPSYVLFKLDFKSCNQIKKLMVFGNDWGCDAIPTIPVDLLSRPTFRKVVFDGVRFPTAELDRLKKEFPEVQLTGNPPEYSVDWDSNLNN